MNNQIIVSDRWDGFGERMLSFLNAMYIADRFGYKFGFLWYELKEIKDLNDKAILSPKVPSANKIFDGKFLKEHLCNEIISPSYDDVYWWSLSGKSLKEVLLKRKEEYILFSFQGDLSNFFIDINKKEYYDKIQILFNSIPFLSNIKETIFDSLNISKELKDFVTIHIRGGDIIYNPELTYRFKLKAFPLHLASYFIEHIIENNKKIIILGNDLKSNSELKKKLNKNKRCVLIIDDLIFKKYNYIERFFFEIILMSKSDILYATGGSGFSNFASRINSTRVISLHINYTEEWIYKQLQYSILNYKFNDVQNSFSYLMLYHYAEKLQKTNIVKVNILKKSLKLNTPHFYIFSILYIDLLLNIKRFYFIDVFLLNLDIDFFCDILLSNIHGSFFYSGFWKNYFCDDMNHTKSISILYLKLKMSNFIIKNNLDIYCDENMLSFYSKMEFFLKDYDIKNFSFTNFLQLFEKNDVNKKYIFYYRKGFYLINSRISTLEDYSSNLSISFFDYIDFNLNNLLKNSLYYKISYQIKTTSKLNIIKYIILLYKLFRIKRKNITRRGVI